MERGISMRSSTALAVAAVVALAALPGRASAQDAPSPEPVAEAPSLPPPPTVTEPQTPALPPPAPEVATAPPPRRERIRTRRWMTLPVLRLAVGVGGDVPSHPEQTQDVVLTLHAGMQLIGEARRMRGLLLEPELGYSLRRAPLGDEHLFNIGLGLGYSYEGFITIAYMPYFIVGSGAYFSPLPDRRVEYGLRHGLLVGVLYSLLTAELSHQVLLPSAGAPLAQDLRLLIGIDISRWVVGTYALIAYRKRSFLR